MSNVPAGAARGGRSERGHPFVKPKMFRPVSAVALAFAGAVLITLGLYFALLRPAVLPEDPRIIKASLAQIHATLSGLRVWLRRVSG